MAYIRIQLEGNQHHDYDLKHDRSSIGRSSDNDIVIENASVSNYHARLNYNQGYFLTDLRSSNGTFLNGKKILHIKLSHGDLINFAGTPATFYE